MVILVERRRTKVSSPKQRRMLFSVIWPAVVLIASNGGILSILLFQATTREFGWVHLPLILALTFLLIMGVLVLINTRKAAHQILGPLVRIRHVLAEWKCGESSARIRLRPGDYLTDLADEINDLLDDLDYETWADSEAETAEEAEPAVERPRHTPLVARQ